MKKAIQVSIGAPCHENWDNMNPVEKGKFCGSCQKQVIDFSAMSDHDIAQFFRKPTTGSVCGRFKSDQLNRDIAVARKRIPWLKYFFQIAFPALLFSKASGQTTKPPRMDRSASNDSMKVQAGHDLRILGMVLPTTIVPEEKKTNPVMKTGNLITIKGKVVNEQGDPVVNAQLSSGGQMISMTDQEGRFCIPYNKFKAGEMEVTPNDFAKQRVALDAEDAGGPELFVQLKREGRIKSSGSSMQTGEGLQGKIGGLTVVRNWEPRLFYRRGVQIPK